MMMGRKEGGKNARKVGKERRKGMKDKKGEERKGGRGGVGRQEGKIGEEIRKEG